MEVPTLRSHQVAVRPAVPLPLATNEAPQHRNILSVNDMLCAFDDALAISSTIDLRRRENGAQIVMRRLDNLFGIAARANIWYSITLIKHTIHLTLH